MKVNPNHYTHLRNGEIGCWIGGEKPSPGDILPIRMRGGGTREETIGRVIWSSKDGSRHLCTMARETLFTAPHPCRDSMPEAMHGCICPSTHCLGAGCDQCWRVMDWETAEHWRDMVDWDD